MNESAFLSRGYDFADVAIVSDEELACFEDGDSISGDSWIGTTYDGAGDVWLLVGAQSASDRYRVKLPDDGWQGVLKTWGITASTYDDLQSDDELGGLLSNYPTRSGAGTYRDGSLVSTIEDSAVYVMQSGVARPIDRWETLLLLGWEDRAVVEVESDEFDDIVTLRGSCGVDSYCLTSEDVATCGGPDESVEDASSTGSDDTAEETAEEEEEDDVPADDTDVEDEPEEDVTPGLWLEWVTPDGAIASSIALSGEFTDENGYAYGWNSDIITSYMTDSLGFGITDAGSGDRFRYSYEYVTGYTLGWSCQGPFPPGTVQGTPSAEYNGTPIDVDVVDDPGSDGCGLQVTIP